MPWSEPRALERIARHRASSPETAVSVFDFSDYMRSRRVVAEQARALGATPQREWYVPPNRAVTTHGVHIYANLLAYNERLVEQGRETEASHARALQLLHFHYSACDLLTQAFDIQRVDFHGGRLHAVVLTPEGEDREGERIAKALAFAAAFREMVDRAGRRYGADFQTDVRIGMDCGPAVAVNSGRASEPEPLFIGSPANHAAKLADGDEPGIFLSPRLEQARTGLRPLSPVRFTEEAATRILSETVDIRTLRKSARSPLDEAYATFVEDQERLIEAHGGVRPAEFTFHYRQPPLRSVKFADHPPSNSIRLPLASVFADIDGFTAYVDAAIANGRVAEAVSNLHVLRAEMAAVLQDDFGGRKIRFIGDCLHGVIAIGNARDTDAMATIKEAVLTAAAIRSSFELCRARLPGIATLGIAIGIEYGPTPMCRLGLRGDASVRCSSSKATCVSEAAQAACGGVETAIGEQAYSEGGATVKHLFGPARRVPNLTYPAAEAHLSGVNAPAVVGAGAAAGAPTASAASAAPMRAHSAE